jgi:hypothetical protein
MRATREAATRHYDGGVDYFVVTVRDKGDLAAGIRPHEARFEFHGESCAAEAWACAASAIHAGFAAVAERVGVYKAAASR